MAPGALQDWIQAQQWYQTIQLRDGTVTPGKFPTHLRLPTLAEIDFRGKRVLDVGCNSGQYSLFAKQNGAREVIGIDIDEERLGQARTLADHEGLDVAFLRKGLFEMQDLGPFDVVLCIAVLTEVTDFFGAVEALKGVIGAYAFLELDLAKPLLHVPDVRTWLRRLRAAPAENGLAEVVQTKRGSWALHPTFDLLEAVFGDGFRLRRRGRGVRYDMVDVTRTASP